MSTDPHRTAARLGFDTNTVRRLQAHGFLQDKAESTTHGRNRSEAEDLLGHPAHRAQDARQLQRRLPPVRADAGDRRRLLLHRRPPLAQRRVRPGRAPNVDARPRGASLRHRARRRAVDRLLPEPCDRPRRVGLAALRRDELRPVGPHDAVQGEVVGARVRLGRTFHVPRADGGRHPALPDRFRPGRRRPAPASGARSRRGPALQPPLRRPFACPKPSSPRSAGGSWTCRSR